MEVAGKSRHNGFAPSALLLATCDQCANFPVEANELGIDRHNRPHLRLTHALLDVNKKRGIAVGQRIWFAHPFMTSLSAPCRIIQKALILRDLACAAHAAMQCSMAEIRFGGR